MNSILDEIRIDNLEVFAHHGVYPEETRDGQNFYVNGVLYCTTRTAGLADDLSLSTNYGEVCHFIHQWMQEHTFLLIESVAERLAEEILVQFPLVKAIDLEIRKPYAPIGLPFQSVSVKIHRGWHRVFLAMGSNMGNREQYIRNGIKALEAYPQVRIKQVSSLLVTKPYGGVEQEDFLNGAMEIETLWTPEELLEQLHRIEAAADRKREIHWGPRTLDLDIIFYDKEIVETADLQIPHVDMQNRYFVLKPLSELAPYFRHPLLGKTVSELLGAVDTSAENDSTDR
ncbi:MAG: 2-amino-4-hydroxy-6-hydroxymethyldihydropteridine diphosphokinase [Lachnospiraceae bacterium]|nr:2-amino-4-hydroxy-6-hydroxymethyldihydropteridine diphosphokinase [Lachnospiraceae bacterium]